MTLLDFAQIFFDLVASAAIIVVTVFISVIAYEVINGIRSTKSMLREVGRESSELYQKIESFLERATIIKLITKFFNKKSNKK